MAHMRTDVQEGPCTNGSQTLMDQARLIAVGRALRRLTKSGVTPPAETPIQQLILAELADAQALRDELLTTLATRACEACTKLGTTCNNRVEPVTTAEF